jgi:hypothetical protein
MRRASTVVAWLFVLLGARLLASAPGELARGRTLAAMAYTSAGMVLVIGGGLSILARRRRVERGAAAPRPASTDEWASPSRGHGAAE